MDALDVKIDRIRTMLEQQNRLLAYARLDDVLNRKIDEFDQAISRINRECDDKRTEIMTNNATIDAKGLYDLLIENNEIYAARTTALRAKLMQFQEDLVRFTELKKSAFDYNF